MTDTRQLFAPAAYAEPMLSLLAHSGIDYTKPLGANAPTTDNTIPLSQLLQLFADCQQLLRCPATALNIGFSLPVTAHGPLGFALLSAPTLEHALDIFVKHVNCYTPWLGISRKDDSHHASVIIAPMLVSAPYELPTMELIVTSIVRALMDILGGMAPGEVIMEMHWPKPPHHEAYAKFPAVQLSFSATTTRIAVQRGLLDHPLPLADEDTHCAAMQRLCQERQTRATPWRDLLRRWLTQTADASPTLALAARAFFISPRLLRDRLYREGTSFREELAAFRLKRAEQLLATTRLPIGRIADQCGFKELTSFSRTFRRHHDCSPREFRNRAAQNNDQ